MNRILSTAAFALLILISPVLAADIFGTWIAPALDIQEAFPFVLGETVFSFKVDGTKLSGTVRYSQDDVAEIIEGKVIGDEISFAVKRNLGGKEIKLIYRGLAGLNEISFMCETESESGKRREFTAKREFQRHNDLPLRTPRIPLPPR